jgi:hypothetical protein
MNEGALAVASAQDRLLSYDCSLRIPRRRDLIAILAASQLNDYRLACALGQLSTDWQADCRTEEEGLSQQNIRNNRPSKNLASIILCREYR